MEQLTQRMGNIMGGAKSEPRPSEPRAAGRGAASSGSLGALGPLAASPATPVVLPHAEDPFDALESEVLARLDEDMDRRLREMLEYTIRGEINFVMSQIVLAMSGVSPEREVAQVPGLSADQPSHTIPVAEFVKQIGKCKTVRQWKIKLTTMGIDSGLVEHMHTASLCVLLLLSHILLEGNLEGFGSNQV